MDSAARMGALARIMFTHPSLFGGFFLMVIGLTE